MGLSSDKLPYPPVNMRSTHSADAKADPSLAHLMRWAGGGSYLSYVGSGFGGLGSSGFW